MRILVADDDEFFMKVIERIVSEAGHQVVCVRTGTEAFDQALELQPELIIMEVILPGLLGTEVCQKLRSYSRTASIPVLLVSTGVAEIEATGGDASEFLADDFLHKPFRPERLMERVNRLARMRSKWAERGEGRPPGPPPGAERRRAPRLPIDVEVTVQTAETLLFHPMINISTGGIYMEGDRLLEKGTEVELGFTIPGEAGMIQATGEVSWSLELEEGIRWGTGIRFTRIDPDSLEKIQRYTRNLLRLLRPGGQGQTKAPEGHGG